MQDFLHGKNESNFRKFLQAELGQANIAALLQVLLQPLGKVDSP